MLSDFFKLDEPFVVFDEIKLADHFKTSHDLRSVLYQPDEWLNQQKRVKSFSFTNVSFSKTKFSGVTFTECRFEDCLFIGSTFSNVEFHRCKFINCNLFKTTFDNCYIDPVIIYFDKKYRRFAANIGVHIYQQLYENSSKTRQSDFAMKADFEFRRWKRWQLRYDQKVGKINRFDRALKWSSSLAYEWLAGFGYKPWRFVIATVLVFTTVSLLNMNVLPGALTHDGTTVGNMTLPDAIFYTYSMMTALGFSTIVPKTDFAKILAVSEALVGIGWLGIFTSLLVKRFIK
jgi:hypothetical protein